MQHLYVSLGSLSETLSRAIALLEAGQISDGTFEEIDKLHYEVENKLWNLIKSLEQKKSDGTWINRVSDGIADYEA